jgi:hypothetical protein
MDDLAIDNDATGTALLNRQPPIVCKQPAVPWKPASSCALGARFELPSTPRNLIAAAQAKFGHHVQDAVATANWAGAANARPAGSVVIAAADDVPSRVSTTGGGTTKRRMVAIVAKPTTKDALAAAGQDWNALLMERLWLDWYRPGSHKSRMLLRNGDTWRVPRTLRAALTGVLAAQGAPCDEFAACNPGLAGKVGGDEPCGEDGRSRGCLCYAVKAGAGVVNGPTDVNVVRLALRTDIFWGTGKNPPEGAAAAATESLFGRLAFTLLAGNRDTAAAPDILALASSGGGLNADRKAARTTWLAEKTAYEERRKNREKNRADNRKGVKLEDDLLVPEPMPTHVLARGQQTNSVVAGQPASHVIVGHDPNAKNGA